jgi:hypothetical protein
MLKTRWALILWSAYLERIAFGPCPPAVKWRIVHLMPDTRCKETCSRAPTTTCNVCVLFTANWPMEMNANSVEVIARFGDWQLGSASAAIGSAGTPLLLMPRRRSGDAPGVQVPAQYRPGRMAWSLTNASGVPAEVIIHKGGNEIVGVIVALMHAQRQSNVSALYCIL